MGCIVLTHYSVDPGVRFGICARAAPADGTLPAIQAHRTSAHFPSTTSAGTSP